MPKAVWNGVVIAESDRTQVVEGNHYFPPDSVNPEYLRKSETTTHCPWKGDARYYTLVVNGEENRDAAWYYPDAKPKAKDFENYVAFWKGVEVG